MKSKIKYLSLILISSLLISGCTIKKTQEENIDLNTVADPENSITITSSTNMTQNNPIISLKTKNGEILIKLYQNKAPKTVANFIKKADSGFYDNLIFHRVVPGFVAQGGDPTGSGMGGNKQDSELNDLPFVRGSIGLARTDETMAVSNDSQFFICFTTENCQHLTSEYVNFGEVVSGLDVLDKINQGDKILSITSRTK
jgi:peptidyl-prolyl cis-trans isomerase B (cyclophilin B)